MAPVKRRWETVAAYFFVDFFADAGGDLAAAAAPSLFFCSSSWCGFGCWRRSRRCCFDSFGFLFAAAIACFSFRESTFTTGAGTSVMAFGSSFEAAAAAAAGAAVGSFFTFFAFFELDAPAAVVEAAGAEEEEDAAAPDAAGASLRLRVNLVSPLLSSDSEQLTVSRAEKDR